MVNTYVELLKNLLSVNAVNMDMDNIVAIWIIATSTKACGRMLPCNWFVVCMECPTFKLIEKYINVVRWQCESHLCWFPKFDSCRSSAEQLARARPETPSRWSCTADSLLGTSCRADVRTPPPPAHSPHVWMQGDIDSQLKSLAHLARAEIHMIQQLLKPSTLNSFTDLSVSKCKQQTQYIKWRHKMTQYDITFHTSSISLIHRSMPSNDQRFVMSYTSTMPYKYTPTSQVTCYAYLLHYTFIDSIFSCDHYDNKCKSNMAITRLQFVATSMTQQLHMSVLWVLYEAELFLT